VHSELKYLTDIEDNHSIFSVLEHGLTPEIYTRIPTYHYEDVGILGMPE
jgi:hypothetical protein